ncbi:uncharacterized protein LOC123559016 [Mercenaria mercenaria]|uniref:uncharacterized protein LOC123559016 n=1 Tax=Mercenaria mercenaria TaxID=6596 RepID=UPI00234F796F|nr:uncharacterized protein LOC123559016 [Mercenaria mercenaria]
MATDGNKSQMLRGGHETFYEFSCTLCDGEGKHVEADRYCKECLVYMCYSCVQNHNRFPLNKRHLMLSQSRFVEVANTAPLVSFPTKRCTKHHGELINIFCGNHNVVCCSVCKALEHNLCVETKHLPDAAKGIQVSTEYTDIKNEMEAFLSDVNAVLLDRKTDIKRLAEDKEKVKQVIGDFRKKVDKHFENLERKAFDVMREKQKELVSNIDRDVRYLNGMKTEAEDTLKQLESFQSQNESELFVYVKEGKQLLKNGKERVREIARTLHKQTIHFEVSSKIEEYLQSLDTLGSFSGYTLSEYSVPPPQIYTESYCQTARKFGQFNVKETSDLGTCSIRDICFLHDNSILITDDTNMKLKRLNQSYELIDSVKLPDDCYYVCSVCPGKAAVFPMFYGEVQFVSVGKKMTLTKSFCVRNVSGGITCIDDKMYVCCGSDEDPDTACVEVYTHNGEWLYSIPQKPQHLRSAPRRITSIDDGHYLFVTSCHSDSITTLDLAGNAVNTFSHDMLDSPEGMCRNDKGQLFVCDGNNNTIVLFSPKHQKIEVILKEADGIKDPLGICYDQEHSRLLIGCRHKDELIVFSL